MNMFCYQCEQVTGGTACEKIGNCGKDPETAAMQDLLVHMATGVSRYAHRCRTLDAAHPGADAYVLQALFTTVTNVNFDPARIGELVHRGAALRDELRARHAQAAQAAGRPVEALNGPASCQPAAELSRMITQGHALSAFKRIQGLGADLAGLQDLLLFGLKGTAAYAEHARVLGYEDDAVYAFMHETLDYLAQPAPVADELLRRCLQCGEVNLRVMELLDRAHTDTFGHPSPVSVRVTPVKGKAILVSGHDLHDLERLLRQTEGLGIHIYTHGEMLPAHGYPELRKYPHLAGNYGGAWQDQKKEFDEFPGAILMTTNCIQEPRESYKGRLFTTGLVAWPGVTHLRNGEFGPVIEAALEAPGFAADAPEQRITVGFGHHAVLGVADQVIAGVKQGAIRHFFLIGGCDGAKRGRNYYTDFAEAVPDDCVILTLACGKYRFNKLDFGDIGGIPRLLDCGQCNDAYSAIRIASALADAFGCGVNDLPLSLVLSWYEQKAVCILLTLLHLGIRNIRLGPSLPAFITPAVLGILVEKFGIKAVGQVEADLADCLQPRAAG